MKKIYTLLVAFMVTSISFGQGSESFTNSMATASYATDSFVGDGGVTWSYVSSRDENGDANSSGISGKALMLRNLATASTVTSSSIPGGIGDFSVKLYKGFTGGGNRQVELFVNGVSKGTSTPFDDFMEHTFTVNGINVGGNVIIELRDITTKQVIVDDISWTGFAGPPTPGISFSSPSNAAVFAPGTTNVNVDVLVQNFVVGNPGAGIDGHIHWTIETNAGGPVAQPMKYNTNTEAITVADGNSYTVVMRLVDNSHVDIVPLTNATVNFSVQSSTPVANIAALRAGTTGNLYTLTGEALLTYQQSFRNQKFIEDTSGGILIDDSAGNITTVYTVADGITGITGELGAFGGMMQFIPSSDPGVATSTSNTLTPQSVTLAMLTASPEMYESELVEVTGVMMDNTTPNFAGGVEHNMTQSTDNFLFRSTFYSANYASDGAAVPTVLVNIVGIVNERTGSLYYLTARDAADFSVVLGVQDFAIAGFNIYPNPSSGDQITISTTANATKEVEVFNILGKRVIKTTVENTLNVKSLQSGVYIVKVTENGATATKKLVIR